MTSPYSLFERDQRSNSSIPLNKTSPTVCPSTHTFCQTQLLTFFNISLGMPNYACNIDVFISIITGIDQSTVTKVKIYDKSKIGSVVLKEEQI